MVAGGLSYDLIKENWVFDDKEVMNLFHRCNSGTTCEDHIQLRNLFVVDEKLYGFVHHRGHSEYLNRFDGNTWCGTWYAVWDVQKSMDNPGGGIFWFSQFIRVYEKMSQKLKEDVLEVAGLSRKNYVLLE